MLLALDLGMHTGWCLFSRRGQRMASGTWNLGQRDRGDAFLSRVESMVRAQRVTTIAHEHVAALHQHASADAAHLFGGWLMLLSMVAARTGAKLVRVPTPEVYGASGVKLDRSRAPKGATAAERRAHSATRREKNKAAQVAAALARGWLVSDDNEADACFVGVAAMAKGTL